MTLPTQRPRAKTAIRVATAVALVAGALIAATFARGASVAAEGVKAVTPAGNKAAIYNTFGSADAALVKPIKERLESEGYEVKVFSPTDGTANYPNFVSMASADVVVLDTHGFGTVKSSSICAKPPKRLVLVGRQVQQDPPIIELPCTGTPAPPKTEKPKPVVVNEPLLLLAWYANEADAANAVASVPGNIPIDGLVSTSGVTTGVASEPQGRTALLITASGIGKLFAKSKVSLVFASVCHGAEFAPAFHAKSFFGYSDVACGPQAVVDANLVFDRLTGTEGPEARSTVEAAGLGGFGPNFGLVSGAEAVVLSPSVRAVSPDAGAVLPPGDSPLSVEFDSMMSTGSANGVLSVAGCGAKLTKPKWSGTSKITATITIPRKPPDEQITVTVHNKAAHAPGQGENQFLDGNRNPDLAPGAAPNRDDYEWKLACAAQPSKPVRTAAPDPTTATTQVAAKKTGYVVTFDGSEEASGNDASNADSKESSYLVNWHYEFAIGFDLYLRFADQDAQTAELASGRPNLFEVPLSAGTVTGTYTDIPWHDSRPVCQNVPLRFKPGAPPYLRFQLTARDQWTFRLPLPSIGTLPGSGGSIETATPCPPNVSSLAFVVPPDDPDYSNPSIVFNIAGNPGSAEKPFDKSSPPFSFRVPPGDGHPEDIVIKKAHHWAGKVTIRRA